MHSNPSAHRQQSPYTQSHHIRPTRHVTFQTPASSTPIQNTTPFAGNTTPIPAQNTTISARTKAALELIGSEIETRSQLTFTSLATPLVFANKPEENGAYKHQLLHIPNTGLYRLKSTVRTNARFLEHENRLWELLGLAHLIPTCSTKDKLEDCIWQEIDRLSSEKELHWNRQRLHVDIGKVVVHNGMSFIKVLYC
jgi:hypothetical protein